MRASRDLVPIWILALFAFAAIASAQVRSGVVHVPDRRFAPAPAARRAALRGELRELPRDRGSWRPGAPSGSRRCRGPRPAAPGRGGAGCRLLSAHRLHAARQAERTALAAPRPVLGTRGERARRLCRVAGPRAPRAAGPSRKRKPARRLGAVHGALRRLPSDRRQGRRRDGRAGTRRSTRPRRPRSPRRSGSAPTSCRASRAETSPTGSSTRSSRT